MRLDRESIQMLSELIDQKNKQLKQELTRELIPLKEGLAEMQTDIRELKTDVTELKSDVATLKFDTAELKSNVTTLKSDSAEFKSDVATIKSDMHGIKQRLDSIESNTESLKSDVRAIKLELETQISRNIQILAENYRTHAERFDQAIGEISSMKTSIEVLTITVKKHSSLFQKLGVS